MCTFVNLKYNIDANLDAPDNTLPGYEYIVVYRYISFDNKHLTEPVRCRYTLFVMKWLT